MNQPVPVSRNGGGVTRCRPPLGQATMTSAATSETTSATAGFARSKISCTDGAGAAATPGTARNSALAIHVRILEILSCAKSKKKAPGGWPLEPGCCYCKNSLLTSSAPSPRRPSPSRRPCSRPCTQPRHRGPASPRHRPKPWHRRPTAEPGCPDPHAEPECPDRCAAPECLDRCAGPGCPGRHAAPARCYAGPGCPDRYAAPECPGRYAGPGCPDRCAGPERPDPHAGPGCPDANRLATGAPGYPGRAEPGCPGASRRATAGPEHPGPSTPSSASPEPG